VKACRQHRSGLTGSPQSAVFSLQSAVRFDRKTARRSAATDLQTSDLETFSPHTFDFLDFQLDDFRLYRLSAFRLPVPVQAIFILAKVTLVRRIPDILPYAYDTAY